jgi:hypothetical protein
VLIIPLLLTFGSLLIMAFRRAPTDSGGARHLLTGYMVIMGCFTLYGLLPAFLISLHGQQFLWAPGYESNDGYVRAILLTIVALLCFLYGNNLAAKRSKSPPRRAPSAPHGLTGQASIAAPAPDLPRPRAGKPLFATRLLYVAVGLVVVGMIIRLYVVSQLGGIGQTLARLSGGARTELTLAGASPRLMGLRTLSGIADVGATWLLVSSIRTGRGLKLNTLIFALVIGSGFLTSGKRLVVILPFVVVACAVHIYRKKITLAAAPWALGLVALLGMATLLLTSLST